MRDGQSICFRHISENNKEGQRKLLRIETSRERPLGNLKNCKATIRGNGWRRKLFDLELGPSLQHFLELLPGKRPRLLPCTDSKSQFHAFAQLFTKSGILDPVEASIRGRIASWIELIGLLLLVISDSISFGWLFRWTDDG